jgi:tight adherence protein B
MSPALTMLLTFLAGVLAVAGVYSILSDLYLRDRSRVSKRVDEQIRERRRQRASRSVLFKNKGGVPAPDAEEERPGLRQRFEELLEQSGLELAPPRLLLIMGGAGVGCGLLAFLTLRTPVVALALALAAAAAPLLYVVWRRQARLAKMMTQLPDALDLMARVIRAGQTMSQAMQAVADEFDPPLAAEFAYCYEQQNFGLPPEVALRELARRAGLLEIKIFVLALVVQQQTGGNLAELLEKLATVIRERFRVQGKVRTLTAEGRLQAWVLLGLPPALLLLLTLLNPAYTQVFLTHPGILVGVAVSELLGALWIRKIVNFDF